MQQAHLRMLSNTASQVGRWVLYTYYGISSVNSYKGGRGLRCRSAGRLGLRDAVAGVRSGSRVLKPQSSIRPQCLNL